MISISYIAKHAINYCGRSVLLGRSLLELRLALLDLLKSSSERLLLKVTANEWLTSSSIIDLNTALQKLKEHLQKPPGKSSGYWKSDNIVFYALNHEGSGRLGQAQLTLPD